MKNVALIELSESHSECIYSQVLFLRKKTNNIHLILHPELNDQTEYSIPEIKRLFITAMNNFLMRIKTYLRIRNYLKTNNIDTVIFNTTTGRIVRELLLFLPKNINYTGSIHDGRKLVNSSTQKAISRRVNKYFTLNDYVTDYLREKNISNVAIRSYYPVFFPEMDQESIKKDDSDFWIIIPGKVEQKRRNYFSLIEVLTNSNLPADIKFILLGPSKHFNGDGSILEEKINTTGLNKNFILFDDFVSDKTYFSFLKNADLIMPLVEPGNEFYETYKYSQITGAYNIAFGFQIPLLYHDDLSHINDLVNFGISYNSKSLVSVLTELVNTDTLIAGIRQKIMNEEKFTLDFQSRNYLEFLE